MLVVDTCVKSNTCYLEEFTQKFKLLLHYCQSSVRLALFHGDDTFLKQSLEKIAAGL